MNIYFNFHILPQNLLLQDSFIHLIESIDEEIFFKEKVVSVLGGKHKITVEHAQLLYPKETFDSNTETIYSQHLWSPRSIFKSCGKKSWFCFGYVFCKNKKIPIAYCNGHLFEPNQIKMDHFCVYPVLQNCGIGKQMSLFVFNNLKYYWPTRIIKLKNIAGEIGEKCYCFGAHQWEYQVENLNVLCEFTPKTNKKHTLLENFSYMCKLKFNFQIFNVKNVNLNQLISRIYESQIIYKRTSDNEFKGEWEIKLEELQKCVYIVLIKLNHFVWMLIGGDQKSPYYLYGYQFYNFNINKIYQSCLCSSF